MRILYYVVKALLLTPRLSNPYSVIYSITISVLDGRDEDLEINHQSIYANSHRLDGHTPVFHTNGQFRVSRRPYYFLSELWEEN